MSFKRFFGFFSCAVLLSYGGIVGCGSGGSVDKTTSSSVAVSSLTAFPDLSTMVTGSGSSSSLSSLPNYSLSGSLKQNAVNGTPPTLTTITSNIDQYFWNGLLAQIIGSQVNPGSDDVQQGFFQGMGNCFMAQNLMYAMKNIAQANTTTCYMKTLSSAAAVAAGATTLVSGAATSADIFKQSANDRLIKVQINDFPQPGGEQGQTADMDIFFVVKGTSTSPGSDGYAFDMYMCEGGAPGQYQQYRANTSNGALNVLMYESFGNQFVSQFSGSMKDDGSGNIIFDTSKQRSATNTYVDSSTNATFKDSVVVSGSGLANLHMDNMMNTTNKSKILTRFGGNSLVDVILYESGVAMSFSGNDFVFGTEWQVDHYLGGGESGLVADVTGYDFSDSLFTEGFSIPSTISSGLNNYNCSATPDAVVSIDVTNPLFATAESNCEVNFSDVDFCFDGDVATAQTIISAALGGQ